MIPLPTLHHLPITNAQAGQLVLASREPYRVVAALDVQSAALIPVQAKDMASEYIVPGGLDGMPYITSLGPAGFQTTFLLSQPANYLLVATYGTTLPQIEPYVPVVVQGRAFRGYTPRDANNVYKVVYYIHFSDNSSAIYALDGSLNVVDDGTLKSDLIYWRGVLYTGEVLNEEPPIVEEPVYDGQTNV